MSKRFGKIYPGPCLFVSWLTLSELYLFPDMNKLYQLIQPDFPFAPAAQQNIFYRAIASFDIMSLKGYIFFPTSFGSVSVEILGKHSFLSALDAGMKYEVPFLENSQGKQKAI